MQVSVIIPVYNVLPLAKECVESIFAAGSKLIFEVIVVDNGSSPDVEAWLRLEEQRHRNLRHLRYEEPLGFSRAVNAGAAAAFGEVLVILNSDTVVTPGWLDGLYLALSSDPSLGVITPCTNHTGDTAQMDFRTIDLPLSKALALAAAKPHPPRIRFVPQRLTFFCFATRRAVWQELNGLDESYRVGTFEDDDLCLRLRVKGFRLGIAEHLFVYHYASATFRANGIHYPTWMTENAANFANHARRFAEISDPAQLAWPKRSAPEISVVILPRSGAPLHRTLLSLRNQTVCDFEILAPNNSAPPTGIWIAYVTAGDILYPFHLEALQDALQRTSSEAIFANGWVSGATQVVRHPDAERKNAPSGTPLSNLPTHTPLMLAGWMHHHSLDPQRLWEQTVPVHWPHLTWEMSEAPAHLPVNHRQEPAWSIKTVVVESARSTYRRLVPYETRLSIDSRLRGLLRLGSPSAVNGSADNHDSMRLIADSLASTLESSTDAGKFATDSSLPDVIFFNIIRWTTLTQRPQHFARGLAERGHRVFWIEPDLRPGQAWWTGRSFQQVLPRVHLVQLPGVIDPPGRCDIYSQAWSPVLLDAMSGALAQMASAYGISQAVSLVHFPRWEPLVARARNQFGWKVIYDCLDDQDAFAVLYQTPLRDLEKRLIGEADSVITSSAVLRQRLFGNRSSIFLQNAADYELFSSCTSAGYLRHLPRPVVGFFGALADWLDMNLIRAAALEFPQWSFVYIGLTSFSGPEAQARWRSCTSAGNITVLPQMDPCTLAAFLAEFDVCTVPFLDVPVTRAMNAVKIYEYLAAGKPVVSRDLPEVRNTIAGEADAASLIALYATREEFFAQLQAAVANDNPDLVRRRQNFASRHDWSSRVDVLAREITGISMESTYYTSSSRAFSNGSNTRSQE